jgi:hypothetical protein
LWNFYDNFGWGWAPGTGCNTWYGGYGGYGGGFGGFGGGGWVYNIGRGPRGYLPPKRPPTLPGHPHPMGSRDVRTASVITVDRRPPGGVNMAGYARPTQPVQIAGHTVEPLRPVTPRQVYDRPAGVVARQPGGYYPAPSHPAAGSYVRPATGGYQPPAAGNYHPPASTYSGHPSSAPAPASHPSYSGGGGGGGGGGGHPSGGGGAVHK